jgi:hypothetical protein
MEARRMINLYIFVAIGHSASNRIFDILYKHHLERQDIVEMGTSGRYPIAYNFHQDGKVRSNSRAKISKAGRREASHAI